MAFTGSADSENEERVGDAPDNAQRLRAAAFAEGVVVEHGVGERSGHDDHVARRQWFQRRAETLRRFAHRCERAPMMLAGPMFTQRREMLRRAVTGMR